MATAIRSQIIKIGNSQGIRIPKYLLEQSGIQSDIEIEVNEQQLIIRPASKKRQGWSEAFATMAQAQEDQLLDAPNLTDWDETEWQW